MAPKIVKADTELLKVEREFIQAIGAMWSRWGFLRTSGLVIGALYLADAEIPMTQSELAKLLRVSRSTLSASISELQSANLITASKSIGSRQEHYTTFSDPRELFLAVLRLLKRRDVEPVLLASKKSAEKADGFRTEEKRIKGVRERLRNVAQFYTLLDLWMSSFGKLSSEQLEKAFNGGIRSEGKNSGAA